METVEIVLDVSETPVYKSEKVVPSLEDCIETVLYVPLHFNKTELDAIDVNVVIFTVGVYVFPEVVPVAMDVVPSVLVILE